MKNIKVIQTILFVIIMLPFNSCKVEAEKIVYGEDGCHFCSMTVVDKIHGAEMVTKKGKVFKFDAMECLINFSKEVNPEDVALYLTNHYNDPEELIDATKATFLISQDLPSPMGAFLTAFENKKDADEVHKEKGGELYSWEELLIKLKPEYYNVSDIGDYKRPKLH